MASSPVTCVRPGDRTGSSPRRRRRSPARCLEAIRRTRQETGPPDPLHRRETPGLPCGSASRVSGGLAGAQGRGVLVASKTVFAGKPHAHCARDRVGFSKIPNTRSGGPSCGDPPAVGYLHDPRRPPRRRRELRRGRRELMTDLVPRAPRAGRECPDDLLCVAALRIELVCVRRWVKGFVHGMPGRTGQSRHKSVERPAAPNAIRGKPD